MAPPTLSRDVLAETLRVLEECDSVAARAIERLGISHSTWQNRIRRAKAAGMEIPKGKASRPKPQAPRGAPFSVSGTSEPPVPLVLDKQSILRDEGGNERARWDKLRQPRMAADEVAHIPDPRLVTKISTHYDGRGRVIGQWQTEKPDDCAREALWREIAAGLKETLPRSQPIQAPAPLPARSDLMVILPVGDHHTGLYAWREEAGGDYDLDIAEKLLAAAGEHLIASAPPCDTALVALLGDAFHYDSLVAETPTSRNRLDADSRYPKMVRVVMRSVRRLIEAAATRFNRVHVIIEIGNHDLATSIFLAEALHHIYEREPRISIDTSPQHVHYYRFGRCLIGTHHGHGIKLDNLPLIMATDRPQDWGDTTHRMWLTGHVHHRKFLDMAGCTVESFRVLGPSDAWAHQKGYRSARGMQSIVLHAEYGEVARHSVNPEMLADSAARPIS